MWSETKERQIKIDGQLKGLLVSCSKTYLMVLVHLAKLSLKFMSVRIAMAINVDLSDGARNSSVHNHMFIK